MVIFQPLTDLLSLGFFYLKYFIMIYKFKNEDANTIMEVSQNNEESVLLSIEVDNEIKELVITKNTLYQLIGALHSLQTQIKKDVQNG